jgi:hypothetical protein
VIFVKKIIEKGNFYQKQELVWPFGKSLPKQKTGSKP